MERLIKSVIRPLLGTVAAVASVVGIGGFWMDWKPSQGNYLILGVALLAMLVALWMFFGQHVGRWIQSFAYCMSLGTAVSDSGLSREDVRQLAGALRSGRTTEILPLMVKIMSKTVEQLNQASCELGPAAKRADDGLAKGLADISVGTAVSDSGLLPEDVRELGEAVRSGRTTEILPLMVKLISNIVQQVNQSSSQLGPPAKCADDGLAEGLAKGLLSLLRRENLTDILTTEKLKLLDARPATPDETSAAITGLPVLGWLGISGPEYDSRREEFVEAVIEHSLLACDPFRTYNSTYAFRFDMTNFCFESIHPSIKLEMLREARDRFKDKKFDTVVCIQRGSVAGFLNHFVQEVSDYLKASFCPFPTRESERKEIFVEKLLESCAGGKSTLLVEPLMLDDGELDKAYEYLQGLGATVEGVLILCQESHFSSDQMKNGSQIQKLCVRNEIKGQIVVDLSPI